MKKTILLLSLTLSCIATFANDETKPAKARKNLNILSGNGFYNRDSTWKFGGYVGATISQIALYQWSPGGTNSFAILLNGSAYAHMKKGKFVWDNSFDGKWGLVANGLIRNAALAKRNFQKNIDLLSIKSNFGYGVSKTVYISAKFAFESQFTRSYDYSATDTSNGRFRKLSISKFAAPAMLTIGPGITWKPKEYFTLYFSPVQGKLTFVTADRPGRDTALAADGTFTDNYYNDIDETRFGLLRGKSFMGELGAELDIVFQKEIFKNVSHKSHLNVFSAYLNPNYNTVIPYYYADQDSMGVVDIKKTTLHIPVMRWDNDLVLKINKFLSATLSARFVYQYNALLPTDTRDNSTKEKGADGKVDTDKFGKSVVKNNSLQIFQQFGVGLSFKF